MSDFENWAVWEDSFAVASQTFVVGASSLRFAFEFVAEFSPVRADGIDVEGERSMLDADERLESVSPNAADGRQQPFYHLYSDKFDHDNLIEPMIDAAGMPQRQPPSVPPSDLEDYLSS